MRRIWILDLTLFTLLIALATRFHNDWIMFSAIHQPGAIEPEREQFAKLPSGVPPNAPAPTNWTDIPTHNPFSFDRTDIALLEPKAPPPPPAPLVKLGPKPVLYGVMSIGTSVMASVGGTRPGNQKFMKVGEVIDGWTIVSIADRSMVIKGNDIQQTVIMNDPTVDVPRDHSRTLDIQATAAPTVVTVGAAPAATPAAAPAAAQPQRGRRKIQQVTPFGVREIEIEE